MLLSAGGRAKHTSHLNLRKADYCENKSLFSLVWIVKKTENRHKQNWAILFFCENTILCRTWFCLKTYQTIEKIGKIGIACSLSLKVRKNDIFYKS